MAPPARGRLESTRTRAAGHRTGEWNSLSLRNGRSRYATLSADDRESIEPGDRVVLIIENDARFAKILLDMAREKDFKGLVALDGEHGARGSRTSSSRTPSRSTSTCRASTAGPCSIGSSTTRTRGTFPVHIIIGHSTSASSGLKAGAIAYLEKPVSKEALEDSFDKIGQFIDQQVKRLLVVEDDEAQRKSMIELIGHEDVEITAVGERRRRRSSGWRSKPFDCMVLDLGLEDMNGF